MIAASEAAALIDYLIGRGVKPSRRMVGVILREGLKITVTDATIIELLETCVRTTPRTRAAPAPHQDSSTNAPAPHQLRTNEADPGKLPLDVRAPADLKGLGLSGISDSVANATASAIRAPQQQPTLLDISPEQSERVKGRKPSLGEVQTRAYAIRDAVWRLISPSMRMSVEEWRRQNGRMALSMAEAGVTVAEAVDAWTHYRENRKHFHTSLGSLAKWMSQDAAREDAEEGHDYPLFMDDRVWSEEEFVERFVEGRK